MPTTTSYTTVTLLSFAQWLDNWLLDHEQQYFNTNSRLYYQPNASPTGAMIFSSPFRSFVWDSGVNGAVIFNGISGYFFNASGYTSSGMGEIYSGVIFPQIGISGFDGPPAQINFGTGAYISIASGYGVQSGNSIFFTDSIAQTGAVRVSGFDSNTYQDIIVTIDGSPVKIDANAWGMNTDYVNGRLIAPNGVLAPTAIISGAYSVKGFNLYFANQSQERIVFTNKYYLNSRFNRSQTGIPPANQFVTPCIFISSPMEENEPAGFGGVYNTKNLISMNIFAETQGQLENALSAIMDLEQKSFPQIPPSESPIGPSGTLKNGGYSYNNVLAQYNNPGNLYLVQNVQASKMSDSVQADQSLFIGLAELEVTKVRTIH